MSEVLYDWKSSQRLNDWKLEGLGELLHDKDGCLHVRTFNMGPYRRATNCWLRNVELPENFEVEWTYRNGCEAGGDKARTEGVIIVFNTTPLALKDVFEDPRPHALYSDLCSYGKTVSYTCGFYRTLYGTPSQLRKLGGYVPKTWGEQGPSWKSEDGKNFQQLTIVSAKDEPLSPEDQGKDARFKLDHRGKKIRFWCNDQLIHDWEDKGEYPYYNGPLVGGKMCFRQFSGYIDGYFSNIVVRKL
jgi:hypothetical protein